MKRIYLSITILALALSSCQKYDNFYANQGNASDIPVAAAPAITAFVNSAYEWSLAQGYAQKRANGALILSFMGGGEKMTMTLVPYSGKNTYVLNGRNSVSYEEFDVEFRDIKGEIVITGEEKRYVTGKFSFTVKSLYTPSKYEFTDGVFSIPLQ